VPASVLDAVARALQLDDAERGHLFDLAHAADGTAAGKRPRRRTSKAWTAPPRLQWVLDRFTAPAIVRNGRMDLLATNLLGRAVHDTVYVSAQQAAAAGPPNFARFTFLDLDAAQHFYPHWGRAADTCVSILHTEAGRDPHDKAIHGLVSLEVEGTFASMGLDADALYREELTAWPAPLGDAARAQTQAAANPGRRPTSCSPALLTHHRRRSTRLLLVSGVARAAAGGGQRPGGEQ
jgi:transcription regulator MmyB-like protein